MNEQVMIYEIKRSAALNAAVLFSDDNQYFYWNEERFKNLTVGDYVFVVNKTDKWVLFTQLDKLNIPTTIQNNTTYFGDLNKNFTVNGQYDKFIRLKIINRFKTPTNWEWKSFGSSENSYLNGSHINIQKAENRIKNISQLKELIDDKKIIGILDSCLTNFTNSSKTEPSIWFVTQGETFKKGQGMNFLWAPKSGKGGQSKFYWENVLRVKKGDFIFNYSDGELKGVSIAISNGYEAENSHINSSWSREGYKVDIALTLLAPPLKGKDFSENKNSFKKYLSKIKNKSLNVNGAINQGYLYEFSKEAGKYIRDLYGKPFGQNEIDAFFDKVQLQQETLRNNSHMEYLNILTAIKTKPFILLAGISGTGKSRLVRTLAFKTCQKEDLQADPNKPGNFELIPVRPNWHDSSELMGYVSRINGEKYIITAFLRFIVKAWKHTDIPFFLCLDEMNLAPVEQYFAEYLSVIETRQMHEGKIVSDYIISKAGFENPKLYTQLLKGLDIHGDSRFTDGIRIPENLVVIGTVNMDETTHSFSRKVLDRAMTFEMNHVDLYAGLDTSQNDWSYPAEFISRDLVIGTFTSGAEVITDFPDSKKVIDFLQILNNELEETPFKIAYRVRDEFLIYCYYASLNPTGADWLSNALDEMINMKIVFRIEGDESRTGTAIDNLIKHLSDTGHPKSLKKLNEMKKKLSFGYTSPWS